MQTIHIICLISFFCLSLGIEITTQTSSLALNEIEDGRCMTKCLECSKGPNSCTKCTEGANCCNWACSKCQNQLTCKSCKEDFKLDQQLNICVFQHSCQSPLCLYCNQEQQICLICTPGYYLNQQMLTCDACPLKCIQCQNSYSCTQCSPRTYWQDGACRPCGQNCVSCDNGTICKNCTQQFYKNENGKCQKCMQSCKKCSSKRDCQQCISKNYFDQTIKQCVPCNVSCAQCIDSSECITCQINYFFNTTTKTCQQCNEIYLHCLTCVTAQSLIPIDSNSGVVCRQCETKYYVSQDSTCQPCILNCLQCKNNDTCKTCRQSYFLNESKQCQHCYIAYCIICANSTSCSICQSGYYYNPNISKMNCVRCSNGCEQCDQFGCTHCAIGYFEKNGNCYKCDSSCIHCLESASNCSICLTGYFKISLIQGTCAKCPQPCSECQNITHCTRCFPGFYIYKNTCRKCSIEGCDLCKVTEDKIQQYNYAVKLDKYQLPESQQKCFRCASGYYINNQKCEKCMGGCSKCTDSIKCQFCFRGYQNHPQGTKCAKCSQNCASCQYITNQTTLCTSCLDGFRRDQGSQNCLPCASNCRYCIETDEEMCIDCRDGFYKKDIHQNKQVCAKCVEPCKTCQAEKECLSCIIGYYLNAQDECIKCQEGCEQCNENGCFICEIGYRFEFLDMSCHKCKVDKCSKCQQSQEKCDICEDGYKYFVPDKIMHDSSEMPVCYRCDQSIEGCKSCESPFICSQCFNGLQLELSDDGLISSCQKESNFIEFFITVGILSIVILILSGVVCIFRLKLKRQKNKSKLETQNLIQQNEYSINSEEAIESKFGKSILSSFSSTD